MKPDHPDIQPETKQNRLFFLLSAAVYVAWFILLYRSLPQHLLEFDELWTLCFYTDLPVSRIFTDLATPNNHPLHTLCCKYVLNLFPDAVTTSFVMRIPAFTAGILIMVSAFKFLRRFPVPGAMPLALSMLAFTPILTAYASTARGYSMQAFFVFAFCLLLWNNPETVRQKVIHGIMLFITAAAACLTVTSGLIFICAGGAAWLVMQYPVRELRKKMPVLIAGILFILFASCWYGSNYSTISLGRGFGISLLNAPSAFFTSLGLILLKTGLLFYVLLTCLLFRYAAWRKYGIFSLSLLFFSFAASCFTNLGPERVYIPLLPPLILTSAMAAALFLNELKSKKTACFLFILLFLLPPCNCMIRLPHYRAIDWRESAPLILAAPEDEYPFFMPSESMRFSLLFPPVIQKGSAHCLRCITLYECGGILTAETIREGEQIPYDVSPYIRDRVMLPGKICKELLPIRPLRETDTITEKTLLFAVSRNKYIFPPEYGWNMLDRPMSTVREILMFVRRGSGWTTPDCLNLQKKSQNNVTFYVSE